MLVSGSVEFRVHGVEFRFRVEGLGFRGCKSPSVDRIRFWVYYNKIPICPIFLIYLRGNIGLLF